MASSLCAPRITWRTFVGNSIPGLSSTRKLKCSSSTHFRLVTIRATDDKEDAPTSNSSPPKASLGQSSSQQDQTTNKKTSAKDKGETTAQVTGAIAVLLSIAYLFLVLFLERRGAGLEPPPPEAYLP